MDKIALRFLVLCVLFVLFVILVVLVVHPFQLEVGMLSLGVGLVVVKTWMRCVGRWSDVPFRGPGTGQELALAHFRLSFVFVTYFIPILELFSRIGACGATM